MTSENREKPTPAATRPWSRSWQEVAQLLAVDRKRGLDPSQARQRLRRYGPNRLKASETRSIWTILLDQFRNVLILFLGAAAALSFFVRQWLEGGAILVAVLIAGLVGFVTETRAQRSMEALRELAPIRARVWRGGRRRILPASQLVPGDVVELREGDVPGADLRIVTASALEADESALTGESIPVAKGSEPVAEDMPLAERTSMLYGGTVVSRGKGTGIVVATGESTEIGRIAALTETAEPSHTPLEKRLEALGRRLIGVTVVVGIVIAVSGILAGKPTLLMLQTGIILAVATIPEGLPVVATLSMARGMWRMAHRNAVLNRLTAVETLGATSVILTDKTGTLTRNRMELTRLVLPAGEVRVEEGEEQAELRRGDRTLVPSQDPELRAVLEGSLLCNEVSQSGQGDPLDQALLRGGQAAGLDPTQIRQQWPLAREEPFDPERRMFDPERRMMATSHKSGADGEGGEEGLRILTKGAPEAVLPCCVAVREGEGTRVLDETGRQHWQEANEALAVDGLRVVALAEKWGASQEDAPFSGLTLLGLMGLEDPPRSEIREALEQSREAGIRVVMVTGDQRGTAAHVGRSLDLIAPGEDGILDGQDLASSRDEPGHRERLLGAPIFARVNPEQKLDLIRLHQSQGAIVAMTGDGVNDAPALKQADMGVAMGKRGTQAAREASDMVLKDDAFGTIVAAVAQGRAIFENIRKATVYLLSGNVGEILAVAGASVAGLPLPLLPLQILYLNLVNDLFPALALGFGEAPAGVMQRPPRKRGAPVLDRVRWVAVLLYGLLVAAIVLLAFVLALDYLGLPTPAAVTVAFFTLSLARLWHVLNMRSLHGGWVSNEITRNPYVWGFLLVSLLLLAGAWSIPLLREVLELANPGPRGWLLVVACSLCPLVLGQVGLALARASRVKEYVDHREEKQLVSY